MKPTRSLSLALSILTATALPLLAQEAKPGANAARGAAFRALEYLPKFREELGLKDDQMQAMQRIAEGMQEPARRLEAEMRERAGNLEVAVAKEPVDQERVMDLFRAVLKAENEMKVLHFQSRLAMRKVLTTEQYAKLQTLAAKGADKGGAPAGDLRERFEQVKREIAKRTAGSEPPREVAEMLGQIERALREGRAEEAKQRLGEILHNLKAEHGSRGPAEPARAGAEALEKRAREVAEVAQRTDNPELRERLQGAMKGLQEAAKSGNREAMEQILRAIEPVLREAQRSQKKE
jgi:Spy/CpxP family protein refolding chaperone